MDLEVQPSGVSDQQDKTKPDRFVSMDAAALAAYQGPTREEFRKVLLRADGALQKSRAFTPTLPSEAKKRARRR